MLQAISPIDGRYADKTKTLVPYFSEEALIRYRVRVEVEYFIALCELVSDSAHALGSTYKGQPAGSIADFTSFSFHAVKNFTTAEAQKVKEIERTTNHDVKAVEYFIKEAFDYLQLEKYKEFIHFGLTSQDINNTAIPLSIKEAMSGVYYTEIQFLIDKLQQLVAEWKDIPLLARTHGQPASPTRLGKEFQVFVTRIEAQLQSLRAVPYAAKFGGATGNYNAHKVAYPSIDWKAFGTHFVEKVLGLHHSFPTTQIEHYDHLAALFDALKRINTILIDLNRDIWTYISMDYFKQKIKAGEVGSSAMPHKVNPIDFENSEGSYQIDLIVSKENLTPLGVTYTCTSNSSFAKEKLTCKITYSKQNTGIQVEVPEAVEKLGGF